jgi:hypothetical protein
MAGKNSKSLLFYFSVNFQRQYIRQLISWYWAYLAGIPLQAHREVREFVKEKKNRLNNLFRSPGT